jgi:hypothetical protein
MLYCWFISFVCPDSSMLVVKPLLPCVKFIIFIFLFLLFLTFVDHLKFFDPFWYLCMSFNLLLNVVITGFNFLSSLNQPSQASILLVERWHQNFWVLCAILGKIPPDKTWIMWDFSCTMLSCMSCPFQLKCFLFLDQECMCFLESWGSSLPSLSFDTENSMKFKSSSWIFTWHSSIYTITFKF